MRIALVSPPFATVRLPSLGLTQLKARLKSRFGERVRVEIHYLNHEFSRFVGLDVYEEIANSIEIYHSGFGDWYFRQIAFPAAPDNRDAYMQRHFRTPSREREIVLAALAKRDEVEPFFDHWLEQNALFEADFVGMTTMFSQTVAAIALLQKLKARAPSLITALGGACCEGVMGRQLRRSVPGIDYVFSGSALVSLPELVASRLDAKPETPIRGVFAKEPARRLALADDSDAELGEELAIDEAIELDYGDYLESFRHNVERGKPALLFETSRGCWWGEIRHCTFCGLNGQSMNYREMSPERALAQFDSLFSRYPGITYFQAVDNILPHRYLETVLPRLAPPADALIYYEVKSNMDDRDVRLLAERRFSALQPGIEALNSSVLKLMQKGVSAFQNLRFLASCQMHGVAPNWNLLIGFPGESEAVCEKYLRDFPLLHHLPPPNGVAPIRFDRFSPYHERPEDYGLELRPFDYYAYVYPFDEAALRNLAYHFVPRDPRFYVPIARWQKKLEKLVDAWQASWTGRAGGLRARLHWLTRDGESIVFDSRSGAALEHRLTPSAAALLRTLETPRRLDALGDAEIGRLRELGLVFEEDGVGLSLVLPGEPKEMHWDRDELWNHGNLPSYLFSSSSSNMAATVSSDSK